ITLRGKVEPVGGIKEKVLAAKRAGIDTVILPRRNEKDLEDVPPAAREALGFVFVDTVDEVLEHALEPRATTRDVPGREPRAAIEEVLRAYRERIADLKRDDRFRSVLVFKNHGAEAGATLEHPHSQLIATPVVPVTLGDELLGARAYHDYRERCLFCDIVR